MSFKGMFHTEETKQKIGAKSKGRRYTEETKKRMSEFHKRLPMEKNGNWKGGTTERDGYLLFKAPKLCKFSRMKDTNGYILLHRLVMATHLKRPLEPKEVVHHINGNTKDNRIENLKLFGDNGQHMSKHKKEYWLLKNIKEEKE